jgi:heme a synthase
VVLHHRAGQPDGRPRPRVAPELVVLGRLVFAAGAVVVFTGTVVTGAGPHGGDEHVERLPFDVPDVARIHGIAVALLLTLTLVTLWRLWRDGAPEPVLQAGTVLVALMVAQAAVGYTQYFTGVPVLLVGVHILGAASVWAGIVHFNLSLFERRAVETTPGEVATPARVSTPA